MLENVEGFSFVSSDTRKAKESLKIIKLANGWFGITGVKTQMFSTRRQAKKWKNRNWKSIVSGKYSTRNNTKKSSKVKTYKKPDPKVDTKESVKSVARYFIQNSPMKVARNKKSAELGQIFYSDRWGYEIKGRPGVQFQNVAQAVNFRKSMLEDALVG